MSLSFFRSQRLSLAWPAAPAAWSGLFAAAAILVITCLCGAALYVRSAQALRDEVGGNLIRTATVAAAMVDGDAHQTFTDPRQETTPAYFRAIHPLAQIQNARKDIRFVYTCVLRGRDVYFVLDPASPGQRSGGMEEKSHIMQRYPDAAPALRAALQTGQAQADASPARDAWGTFFSGYAPIRNSRGQVVGIVGLDLTADRYLARLGGMRRAAETGLALACALALASGVGVSLAHRRLLYAELGRRRAADALQKACEELEMRVEGRTAELAQAHRELSQAYHATIEGWSRALDLRDEETQGHSERVTVLTLRLAEELGVERSSLIHLERGSLLHDIGKMGVPDSILRKRGPLSAEEWVIMRRHPIHAWEMLSPIGFLRPALDIPLYHHEKWDGTGYPQGLQAEEIPLAARIFAVVDIWDALTSDRPYRGAWPAERVFDHMRSLSGTHFDPAIVTAFLSMMEGGPFYPCCQLPVCLPAGEIRDEACLLAA